MERPSRLGDTRDDLFGQQPGRSTVAQKDDEDFSQLADEAARSQRQGDTAKAIDLYTKALQRRADWAQGWRNLGMLLADRGEYARATDAFRSLLQIEPKDGIGWALLGLSEYELGKYDDAYQHINRGRSLGIANADLKNVADYHAALLAILKGDFEVAHHLLVQIAHSVVDDSDVATALGLAALRMSTVPERLSEWPDPRQRNLAPRLGQIELEATHAPVEEVVRAYQGLLREAPPAPGLHYAFGNSLIRAGHYQQGIAEMQEELALHPQDSLALLQIAMAEVKINDYEQAASYADKAVQLAPDLFASHYALGWALFKLGQIDRGIPHLEKAVAMAPDSPQCHYALSQAYARANRKQDAERERLAFARLKEAQARQTQGAVTRESGQPDSAEAPAP